MGVILNFDVYKELFRKIKGPVAEWSALQTGKCGDSSSIPAKVKTFFWRNQESPPIHCLSFWIKFELQIKLNFFNWKKIEKKN